MPVTFSQRFKNTTQPSLHTRTSTLHNQLVTAAALSGLALVSPGALAQQQAPHMVEEPRTGTKHYFLPVRIVPRMHYDRDDWSTLPTCTLTGTVQLQPGAPSSNVPNGSRWATPGADFNLIEAEFSVRLQPRRREDNEDILYIEETSAEILFEILADDEVEPTERVAIMAGSYGVTCDDGVDRSIHLGVYGGFVINDPSALQPQATAIPTRQKSLSAQLNSLRTLSLHNSITRDRSIAKEIDRARQNNSGFRADNLQVRLQDEAIPVNGLLGGAAGDSASFGRWGAFVTGNVDLGKQEKNSALESDFHTNMLIAGVDYKASDNIVLGAAVTHSDTNAGDDRTANTDFRRYSLSLFGSLYSRDRFYVDGMLTYGTSAYDLDRRIARDAGGSDIGAAKTDGDELSASLGAGYNLHHKNVNARLFTFINYVDANIDGYAETVSGDSSAAVVDGMDLQSFIANVGVELSWNINTGIGVFTPMLSIAHEHQYADDSVYVTGRFVGGLDEGRFAYTAPERDDNYLNAQVGLNAVLKNGISAFVSYDTFVDRKDFASGQLSVGARWEF
jgi:outer membrane autotransporter protein